MGKESLWRFGLALLIADQYAQLPGVSAVFVSGSTARQQADHFSDIELSVLWDVAPSEKARAAVVEQLRGDLHRLYPYDANWQIWEDLFFIGRNQVNELKSGCQVEVSHFLVATLEAAVNRVLVDFDPDPALHNLMAGILDGVPLFRPALLDAWKSRLHHYPDGLQLAVIQRHAIIDHFWRVEMFIERGNNLMEISALLTSVLHQVLHLLLGLNRVYYGGFKWLHTLIERLTIAPPNLESRLQRVYTLPPLAAQAEVQALVEETFALLEQHIPGLDITRFRQVFSYRRPQWADHPPLGMPDEMGMV